MSCSTVVFISGRGSNLKTLLENQEHFTVRCVLSNKARAGGLLYAEEHSVETFTAPRKEFESVQEQKQALYRKVADLDPDFVLLAGYMQIVEEEFIERFAGRILNIHPSLLPKFPGLHSHRAALEAGETVHGCTVHIVTKEVDAGPIIAQARCEVRPGDTEEVLAARVLEREHALYPWVVNQIAVGEISLDAEGRPEFSAAARSSAEEQQFLLP